jgi:ZIP family zinc transporter
LIEALLWGLLASSSLVIGAVLAITVTIPPRVIGLILGFGCGALISAVAFELVDEAIQMGGELLPVGMVVGCLAFIGGDKLVEQFGGAGRKRMGAMRTEGSPRSVVVGALLDGIPESMILGLSLAQGEPVSAALLAGVFLSNLPESLSASAGLREEGWSARGVILLWSVVAVVSGAATVLGFTIFQEGNLEVASFALAFAAGAVLTTLVDALIPHAFDQGKRMAGLATVLGFILALAIGQL